MNEQLQAQFDRVETALNTLIDSITSYKPSLAAVIILVEADADLSKGLEQLSTHQANYHTLVSLRATSDALDAQIKSSLALLAETRNELLTATPLTPVSSSDRNTTSETLQYNDLLNYAQRIARFTVPPSRQRAQIVPLSDANATEHTSAVIPSIKQEAPSPAPVSRRQQQPGSPAPTPGPVPSSPMPPVTSHLTVASENRAIDSLPESTKVWLDPTTSYARFTPWPAEDIIRRGALATIQGMLESGIDPESVPGGAEGQALTAEDDGVDTVQREGELDKPDEKNRNKRSTATSKREDKLQQEHKDELSLGFDLYDPGDE